MPVDLRRYGSPEFWEDTERRVEAFERTAPARLRADTVSGPPIDLHALTVEELRALRDRVDQELTARGATVTRSETR